MRPVVMIARPRSGTNALRDILRRSPELTVLGEVFHNRYADPSLGFYPFLEEAVRQAPGLVLPSEANRQALLTGFVELLYERTHTPPERQLVFGVNYNSLHGLNTYWQNSYEAPFLITLLQRLGWKVIHLIRRDVLAALVSEHRAKRSGRWHARKDQPESLADPARVTLPTARLRFELEQRLAEVEALEHALSRHPRVLSLTYETLFDADGKARTEPLAQIAAFLELSSPLPQETGFVRTGSGRISDVIENFAQLTEALRGSRFEGLLA